MSQCPRPYSEFASKAAAKFGALSELRPALLAKRRKHRTRRPDAQPASKNESRSSPRRHRQAQRRQQPKRGRGQLATRRVQRRLPFEKPLAHRRRPQRTANALRPQRRGRQNENRRTGFARPLKKLARRDASPIAVGANTQAPRERRPRTLSAKRVDEQQRKRARHGRAPTVGARSASERVRLGWRSLRTRTG